MTALRPGDRSDSPFHEGELAVQERLGVRERMDGPGRRMLRATLPEQHRELFEELPFVVAGTRDPAGRIWATILAGPPGFVRSPDEHTLHVGARPLPDDPAGAGLTPGAPVALLGIQLETRRRNRANGVVAHLDESAFAVRVEQAFGNCPKYIHERAARLLSECERAATQESSRTEGPMLSPAAAALVSRADTFFLASGASDAGLDVSHRGGLAGFVALGSDGERTVLTVPDYRGNQMFNTLGNVLRAPGVGLIFPDFDDGSLLSLTGEAAIVWEGDEVRRFPGAERLLRIRVHGGVLRSHSLPVGFGPSRMPVSAL